MKLNFFTIFLIILSGCDNCAIKGSISNTSASRIAEQQNNQNNQNNQLDADKDDKNAAMIKVSNAETKVSKIEPDLGPMVPESLKNTKKVIADIKSLVNNPKVSKSDLADKVFVLGLALQSLEKDYADIKEATLTKKIKDNYSKNLKDKLVDKPNNLLQQHLRILEDLKSSDPEVNNFIAEIKQEQKNRALNDEKIKALKKVTDAQELHDKLEYDLAYKTDFQTAITEAKSNIDNATDIDDITKSLTELSNATRTFNQADRMQAEAGYPENTKPKNPEESQQSKNDELFAAIKSGDLALVQELIANGANINAVDKDLKTPLFIALKDKKADITKYLLTNNKNLIQSEKNTISTYSTAFIKDNNQEMVKAILDSDITIPSSFLTVPIEQNNLDMVKILADKVIDINSSDTQLGFKPLYRSTIKAINDKNISLDIIKHLLSKGADPLNKVNIISPLAMAVSSHRLDIVKIFIDKVNDLSSYEYPTKLFQLAFEKHDKALINALINKKLPLFFDKKTGESLLFLAVENNYIDIAKNILDNLSVNNSVNDVINLKNINKNNKTPLHLAVENNNLEMVQALLIAGADVKVKNNHDDTPLYYIAITDDNNFRIAQALIEKGADVNETSSTFDNNSLLHSAALLNKLKLVKLLLEKGANPNVKNNDDKTPLQLAKEEHNAEIVDYLEVDYPISVILDNEKVLRYFFVGKQDISKQLENLKGEEDKKKALSELRDIFTKNIHLAVIANNLDVVKTFIKLSVNPNIKNDENKTPLQLAKEKNNTEIVDYLQSISATN